MAVFGYEAGHDAIDRTIGNLLPQCPAMVTRPFFARGNGR